MRAAYFKVKKRIDAHSAGSWFQSSLQSMNVVHRTFMVNLVP